MAHYTNKSYVKTPGGSLIRIGTRDEESERTRLFESTALQGDTYHDDITSKTWRVRNGTLERYYGSVDQRAAEESRILTVDEIIQKTAEQILAKVREMMEIPLMPQGMPEQIWSRAMEEAARILTVKTYDIAAQSLLSSVKTDPRWREKIGEAVALTDEELARVGITNAPAALEAKAERLLNQPGTWTRIDTPAYKQQMEEMRNKAWTEGVKGVIELLKVHGHHVAAYQVAQASIDDKRWKK